MAKSVMVAKNKRGIIQRIDGYPAWAFKRPDEPLGLRPIPKYPPKNKKK